MEWFINNWYIVIALIVLVAFVASAIVYFFKLPTSTQIANLKEWLKFAVTEAERALGSGTGQLKLRLVYDMAVQNFPWLLKIVSFETFSEWVDEALEWMNKQLDTNNKIHNIVKGEDLEIIPLDTDDDGK